MVRKSLVTSIAALFAFLIMGCTLSQEKIACKADNLLLKDSSFPGTIWEEIGSRDKRDVPSRLGLERAGTSFSTQTQGIAVQDFYRFATATDAEENYTEIQRDWFDLAPKGSVWLSPDELQTVQLSADKYRLDCSRDAIETCRLVALYQIYVVEFKVDMPSLTYTDLVHIIQEIDEKMTSCIGDN